MTCRRRLSLLPYKRNTPFLLSADVSSFYLSVDHSLLIALLRRQTCDIMEEKKNSDAQVTTIENIKLADEKPLTGEVDRDDGSMLDFGGDSSLPPPPVLTGEEEKRLYRKLDWRLMPILSLMYLFSFLDRGECLYVRGTETYIDEL